MNLILAIPIGDHETATAVIVVGALTAGAICWAVGCWYDARRRRDLLAHSCPCSTDLIRVTHERDQAHLHIRQQQMLCDLHHRTLATKER